MSMEVSSNYKDYKNDYLERLQEEREKAKEAQKEQGAGDKSEGIPVPKDEYISSKQSGSRPSGLYRMGQDENGNPKVLYDDPKKCTTNTDKVDREIRKLKEQKQQLEQKINAAAGDEEKVKELEKKLSQVEGELSQKDNDTYRRQNAVFS
ncbi:MAG: hypothetical protein HDR71_07000 [Lachnospiraceae bacterium]|nr:hypothetical protein [Lachnospiraceae bacterium]